MILMAYLSYMLAELLGLSRILTVFFCGILMSHYAWHNVTETSGVTTSFGSWMGIYSCLIFLILLGRAAFVFPLSALANCLNRRAHRESRITFRHQIIIWWAGLMRGAVSIALAFKQFTYAGVTSDPVDATMITNTIIVVLFSTLVFGILTKPLLCYLLPHRTSRKNIAHQESDPPIDDLNLPSLSFEVSAATNISRAK